MAVIARNIVGLKTYMLGRFEYHLSLDGKYGKHSLALVIAKMVAVPVAVLHIFWLS